MLMNGEGVPQNYSEARRYLMDAVKQQLAPAMILLSDILEKGLDGRRPNHAQAVALLQRARDLGSKEATDRLARMT
jgi:TPR repeat protein